MSYIDYYGHTKRAVELLTRINNGDESAFKEIEDFLKSLEDERNLREAAELKGTVQL